MPAGNQVIDISATGFTAISETLMVVADQPNEQKAALSPELSVGEMRVVVTWGDDPDDLDSHLWLPPASASHVYYSNTGSLTSAPFAQLDVDDTDGNGPETITMPDQAPGTYTYAVHNISGGINFADAGAVVRLYGPSGLIAEYTPPTDGGDWWHVFNLNGTTGSPSAVNSVSGSSPAPY